ncbi:photosystem II reaction center protein Psb28 [Rippkaea orientalis PCC 8801]|uniref:Photosystem II reaction center Psb28 protein n=1 Tax=Rippkaea orientalis (strain PCC 8801 / RF-1) TaxID=41431 RepID=PSB28_RIPO1|nr:photosystem II reaction center protein Psb28 [Rippkaea orientalis]B7K2E0.1 RecName: Full=Photosystem II reaction center Psb28 protein; AltName: Full=Photosystem II 13 kDa protein; AltName: Full=Photosystem II reaction center W protein [Rippkaea orientalis PCC 8801]ACK65276.1 photosystem II reaction center protein Psb28 [Rippkaea orientalis PCC 8801]
MAQIQFSRGVAEPVIPDVRLTRSRSGQSGTATFYFREPSIFNSESTDEVTGMYLVDEEGEITTTEVKGKFINGKATDIEAILIMRSPEEWDRFMRFMERYAKEQGLEFSQAGQS